MSQQRTIEISFASRIEYVNLLHAASDEVCRLLSLDQDTAMNIGLALHEAAINAVKHGNRLDPDKRVTVTFSLGAGELEMAVSDQGEGFDAMALEDPRAPGNIGKTNGRGIFLMRNFVDRVEFSYVPGRGTTVLMIKRLPGRDRRPVGSGR